MLTWPFIPATITDSLEWATDIVTCKTAETRSALRQIPRNGLAYTMLLTPAQYARASALARKVGADDLQIPLWSQLQRHAAISAGGHTLTLDCRYSELHFSAENGGGGSVLIWESDTAWQVCRLQTVIPVQGSASRWTVTVHNDDGFSRNYAAPVVVPVDVGSFTREFTGAIPVAGYINSEAAFDVKIASNLAGLTTKVFPVYRGYPVITDAPLTSDSIKEATSREFLLADCVSGNQYKEAIFANAKSSFSLSWVCNTAAERWALRAWLHDMRGRWAAFWRPSWNGDLVVTHDIDHADTTIEIAARDLTTDITPPIDFTLHTTAGGNYFARANSCAAGSSGHEILALSAAFGDTLTAAAIDRGSVLVKSRFNADRVEIAYKVGGYSRVSIPVIEVP